MPLTHKHHIIPKYEGGPDFSENIVELTVTQHAMWHYAEWRRKRNWQDRTAWKMLVGEATEGRQIMRKALGGRNKGQKQGPLTPEQKARQRAGMLGRKFSEETKEKIAAPQRGKPKKESTKQRMSESAKKRTARNREEKRKELSKYLPLTEENIKKGVKERNVTRKAFLRSMSYYGLR